MDTSSPPAIQRMELSDKALVCEKCQRKCPIFRVYIAGLGGQPSAWISNCVNQACSEYECTRVVADPSKAEGTVALTPRDYQEDLADWLSLLRSREIAT